jgi:hypothetical protein
VKSVGISYIFVVAALFGVFRNRTGDIVSTAEISANLLVAGQLIAMYEPPIP